MTKAIFAFTGDPPTLGHKDIVNRASKMFDSVMVGIGANPCKTPLFSLEERLQMSRETFKDIPNASVDFFDGLLVDYAVEQGANVIVRGARNSQDFDDEKTLHRIGQSQSDVDTAILFASSEFEQVSSTSVKALQVENGNIRAQVSLNVKQALEARLSGQYMVGITGTIGTGKSYVADKLVEIGKERFVEVHNVDLDKLGHYILSNSPEPIYKNARAKIIDTFGAEVSNKNGTIDRNSLGKIVFQDKEKLAQLDEIMYEPIMLRLKYELRGKKGIILINGALLAENKLSYLSNNNAILVGVDEEVHHKRLNARGLTHAGIEKRLASQLSTDEKKDQLETQISKDQYGKIFEYNNSETGGQGVYALFEELIKEIDVYGELRFKSTWDNVHANGSADEVYRSLVKKYSEPHRHYHNLQHVMLGLGTIGRNKENFEELDLATLSWFFHDAIYDIFAKDNEQKSGELFYKTFKDAGLPEDFLQKGYDLIVGTEHAGGLETNDQQLLADVDLAGLANPPELFDNYSRLIEQEYTTRTSVSKVDFKAGRQAFLEMFLAKPNIYSTNKLRDLYESKARSNMERELTQLVSE